MNCSVMRRGSGGSGGVRVGEVLAAELSDNKALSQPRGEDVLDSDIFDDVRGQ